MVKQDIDSMTPVKVNVFFQAKWYDTKDNKHSTYIMNTVLPILKKIHFEENNGGHSN